ncbi:hypothetical protein SLE2022_204550 [Rubroshorea leprosula]
MSLEEEGESSEVLWVEESSLGESDSEWEDRELIEDSLQISAMKASTEGDNQPVEEEGCTPTGNFESPLGEARKAKVIDGTDGEAESDGEAKTAGSRHTRKEYNSSNGYTEEVEFPREQTTYEAKKEKQSDAERARSKAPHRAHFGLSQVDDRQEENGPINQSSPNESSNMKRDSVDNTCLNGRKEQSRISVGAKEQKANRSTKESESEEADRSEDDGDEASKFWEGLASEEELSQLRKKGKQQRKLRKSKGD